MLSGMIFYLVASVILFLTGFEVWGELEGGHRAIVFALAFWQLGNAFGWGPAISDPFRRGKS